MKTSQILHDQRWSEWHNFPHPEKGECLHAPIGCGIYQLKDRKTNEYVLFGTSRLVAQRMTTLIGAGTRKNVAKTAFVLENMDNIVYRTIAFRDESSARKFEKELKSLHIHLFNT